MILHKFACTGLFTEVKTKEDMKEEWVYLKLQNKTQKSN